MKQRLIAFVAVLACGPLTVWADKYEDVQSWPIFAGVNELSQFIKQELDVIESRMRELNPQLVEQAANDTDAQKIIKYNNWMAENIFNEYRDFFLWDLEQKSKNSKRIIKIQDDYGGQELFYWLDAGMLDTDECNSTAWPDKNDNRRQAEKKLKHNRDHTCLYPDGFEEYGITYQNFGLPTLTISKDMKDLGIHVHYQIGLSLQSETDDPTHLGGAWAFSLSEIVEDYTEHHQWRNQQQQDIRDGMFSYIPKNRRECNGVFCPIVEVKDMEKWKSNQMPSYSIKGINVSASINYSHDGS